MNMHQPQNGLAGFSGYIPSYNNQNSALGINKKKFFKNNHHHNSQLLLFGSELAKQQEPTFESYNSMHQQPLT